MTHGAARFLIAVLGLLAFTSMVSAESQARGSGSCVEDEEIISFSLDELVDLQPCSFVGAGLMRGIGLNPVFGFDDLKAPELEYYFAFRTYLRSKLDNEPIDDRFAAIVIGLAILPGNVPATSMQDRKMSYYRGFALGEYWEYKLGNSSEYFDIFGGTMRNLVAYGEIHSYEELSCFVQSDLPTVDIDTVLTSLLFRDCLLRSKGSGN